MHSEYLARKAIKRAAELKLRAKALLEKGRLEKEFFIEEEAPAVRAQLQVRYCAYRGLFVFPAASISADMPLRK